MMSQTWAGRGWVIELDHPGLQIEYPAGSRTLTPADAPKVSLTRFWRRFAQPPTLRRCPKLLIAQLEAVTVWSLRCSARNDQAASVVRLEPVLEHRSVHLSKNV